MHCIYLSIAIVPLLYMYACTHVHYACACVYLIRAVSLYHVGNCALIGLSERRGTFKPYSVNSLKGGRVKVVWGRQLTAPRQELESFTVVADFNGGCG